MHTYPVYSFDTRKGAMVLACLGVTEPNNGRMLWGVSLTLNGEDVTELYFGKWNYINCVGDYEPLSGDKLWIYIPMEGSHFLINSQTLEKIDLPPLMLSAATYVKNVFYGHFLVVLSHDTLICKNLSTGIVKTMNTDDRNNRFKDIISINHETVSVITYRDQTKQLKLNA